MDLKKSAKHKNAATKRMAVSMVSNVLFGSMEEQKDSVENIEQEN